VSPIHLEPYREAIRDRICSFCLDRKHDGTCGRPADQPCALDSRLAILVKSVLAVGGSPELGPYITSIRDNLCPTCREDETGDCPLRDLTHCALDSYHLPVIDVIEEVAEEHGHTAAGIGELPACPTPG